MLRRDQHGCCYRRDAKHRTSDGRRRDEPLSESKRAERPERQHRYHFTNGLLSKYHHGATPATFPTVTTDPIRSLPFIPYLSSKEKGESEEKKKRRKTEEKCSPRVSAARTLSATYSSHISPSVQHRWCLRLYSCVAVPADPTHLIVPKYSLAFPSYLIQLDMLCRSCGGVAAVPRPALSILPPRKALMKPAESQPRTLSVACLASSSQVGSGLWRYGHYCPGTARPVGVFILFCAGIDGLGYEA